MVHTFLVFLLQSAFKKESKKNGNILTLGREGIRGVSHHQVQVVVDDGPII